MEEKIEIRLVPAEISDLDGVCGLCLKVAEHNPESHWSENYPNREILRGDILRRELYKAEHEGRLVSIMLIRPLEAFTDGISRREDWSEDLKDPCALGRFCVSPEYQGRGLGRKVMAAALDKARRLGYGAAVLHAEKQNAAALHIYDSMGFRRTGEVREYGEDFICFEIGLGV